MTAYDWFIACVAIPFSVIGYLGVLGLLVYVGYLIVTGR